MGTSSKLTTGWCRREVLSSFVEGADQVAVGVRCGNRGAAGFVGEPEPGLVVGFR